jgi:hypothetical protein
MLTIISWSTQATSIMIDEKGTHIPHGAKKLVETAQGST